VHGCSPGLNIGDIKPANLMFSADRILTVADQGIADVVGGSSRLRLLGGDHVPRSKRWVAVTKPRRCSRSGSGRDPRPRR
jgi:hypothetical protein